MNEDKKVFDKEFTSKPIIFLKGIGRRCEVCNKHIFGRKDKRLCSRKCHDKKRWKAERNQKRITSLHASISLAKKIGKTEYRVLSLYLKKGVIHQIKITPESKELWSLLEKIEQFRDISKPLEITA